MSSVIFYFSLCQLIVEFVFFFFFLRYCTPKWDYNELKNRIVFCLFFFFVTEAAWLAEGSKQGSIHLLIIAWITRSRKGPMHWSMEKKGLSRLLLQKKISHQEIAGWYIRTYTVNPLYTVIRYNENIHSNNNFNVTKLSLRRWVNEILYNIALKLQATYVLDIC